MWWCSLRSTTRRRSPMARQTRRFRIRQVRQECLEYGRLTTIPVQLDSPDDPGGECPDADPICQTNQPNLPAILINGKTVDTVDLEIRELDTARSCPVTANWLRSVWTRLAWQIAARSKYKYSLAMVGVLVESGPWPDGRLAAAWAPGPGGSSQIK